MVLCLQTAISTRVPSPLPPDVAAAEGTTHPKASKPTILHRVGPWK